MELIIKLIFGAAGFGGMSWFIWDSASSRDSGLILLAMILGLVAFMHGFLALAKATHFSKWGASLFWVGMVGTLAYTFPVLGFSQAGWLGWGITVFLAAGSLFIVTYQPVAGGQKRRWGVDYKAAGEQGCDEAFNYNGYPTDKAMKYGWG